MSEGKAVLNSRNLALLAKMRLMDDDFFSETLDNKPEAVQYIVNTILERDDISIVSARTQVEYKSATKRSIRLDVEARDAEGRLLDIEVQRADEGASVKRARFHSSVIDRTLLEKGMEFDEMADSYVIFITEKDKFGIDAPVYHIERKIEEMNDALFGDGSHIIYVNGEYRDAGHPIGRLMHDFNCTKASDMYSEVLADEVRYLKETERGQMRVCKLIEERAKEVVHEVMVQNAEKMLSDGVLSFEKIAAYSGLTLEEVKELADKRSA